MLLPALDIGSAVQWIEAGAFTLAAAFLRRALVLLYEIRDSLIGDTKQVGVLERLRTLERINGVADQPFSGMERRRSERRHPPDNRGRE